MNLVYRYRLFHFILSFMITVSLCLLFDLMARCAIFAPILGFALFTFITFKFRSYLHFHSNASCASFRFINIAYGSLH